MILDLEAVWCHRCHAMAEKAYGDAVVSSLIPKSYIAVRADQDADPDPVEPVRRLGLAGGHRARPRRHGDR